MSANILTLMVGIAGILAGYYFYFLGTRKAKAENARLHRDIAETNKVLSNLLRVRSEYSNGGVVTPSTASTNAPISDVAVEELLRAFLGALVNERGDVDKTRLMREVGAVLGPGRITGAVDVLRRLRDQGVVSWDENGDDLSRVRTLHVRVVQAPEDNDLSSVDKG